MARFTTRLTYANVMSTVAVFLVLGGGTALAAYVVSSNSQIGPGTISGHKPPTGKHANVIAGSVNGTDIAANAVGTNKVVDNTLTGTDIDESSLGEVPSATLGGLGNQSGSNNCFPESTSFATCAVGFIDLPAAARLLIIGQIRAEPDTGNGNGGGSCRVYSGPGPDALTPEPVFVNGGQTDVIAISGITSVVGPGSLPFGLLCNETAGGIRYFDGHVSVVAISPD